MPNNARKFFKCFLFFKFFKNIFPTLEGRCFSFRVASVFILGNFVHVGLRDNLTYQLWRSVRRCVCCNWAKMGENSKIAEIIFLVFCFSPCTMAAMLCKWDYLGVGRRRTRWNAKKKVYNFFYFQNFLKHLSDFFVKSWLGPIFAGVNRSYRLTMTPNNMGWMKSDVCENLRHFQMNFFIFKILKLLSNCCCCCFLIVVEMKFGQTSDT